MILMDINGVYKPTNIVEGHHHAGANSPFFGTAAAESAMAQHICLIEVPGAALNGRRQGEGAGWTVRIGFISDIL